MDKQYIGGLVIPADGLAKATLAVDREYAGVLRGCHRRQAQTEELLMSLKSSFAIVLRALRSKRNITQRDFGDTSRTFLSKLEGGKSSLTLDKLEQVSQRLQLSPLTLLTLTLSLESGKSSAELIDDLRLEIERLEGDGGVPGLDEPLLAVSA